MRKLRWHATVVSVRTIPFLRAAARKNGFRVEPGALASLLASPARSTASGRPSLPSRTTATTFVPDNTAFKARCAAPDPFTSAAGKAPQQKSAMPAAHPPRMASTVPVRE
jgi:hypothetical protein